MDWFHNTSFGAGSGGSQQGEGADASRPRDRTWRSHSRICKETPADRKYAKKQLFDVLGYMKTRFATTQTRDTDGEVPMPRAAFNKYCDRELGLEEPEIESYWQELYNNPRIERDDKGYRGRQQLWVPVGPRRERDRIRGVTDSVTEASKQQKQYTAHDLQVLLDHAHNQKTSLCDSFIIAGRRKPRFAEAVSETS